MTKNVKKGGTKGGAKAKNGKAAETRPSVFSERRTEINCIIAIAFSILLIASLFFHENMGVLGRFFIWFLPGLLGVGAYALPFLVIVICLYIAFMKEEAIPRSRVVIGAACFLAFISLVHVISVDVETGYKDVWDYIAKSYEFGAYTNGGLIGGLIGRLMVAALGRVGSYIFFGAVGAILIIVITGQSLFALLRKLRDKTGSVVSSRVSEYRERRSQRRLLEEESDGRGEYEGRDEGYERPKPVESAYFDEYEDFEYERIGSGQGGDGARREARSVGGGDVVARGGARDRGVDLITDRANRKPGNVVSFPEVRDAHSVKPAAAAIPPSWEESARRQRDVAQLREFMENTPVSFSGREDEPETAGESPQTPRTEENGLLISGIGFDSEHPAVVIEPVLAEEENPPGGAARDEEDYDPYDDFDGDFDEFKVTYDPATYKFPPIELLKENNVPVSLSSRTQIYENSKKLEETLKNFGVEAKVVEVSAGPAVTRYALSPGVGVKVSKISGLADDLALNLAATGIRIEAPVPGKSVVGIEIPNQEVQPVFLREIIRERAFEDYPSKLAFALGKDISGNPIVTDIAKMPHLLVAGSTGSGKSVCVNTLITSIIFKARPDEVKLILIDPKVVELSVYKDIPHLIHPVVTDMKMASNALNAAVDEMEERYNNFAKVSVRDLSGYNASLAERGEAPLPQIVIIIDELADLMMTNKKEVEESICRLAQKARAAGIHLVIATQRPSVDVITGLIKANVPSRLAFAVQSGIDSRTILDQNGAEKLLGKGDMLFNPIGLGRPLRIQGAFISDKEVEAVVTFLKETAGMAEYDEKFLQKVSNRGSDDFEGSDEVDDLFYEAVDFIIEKERASSSLLQRKFKIGYNRAARLMEEIEKRGIVEPGEGSKPRKVLINSRQWESMR